MNLSKAKQSASFVGALAVMVGCNKHRFITKIMYIAKMHINVFCEASFGFRGRKLVNCFGVTLRYETEQPSSLGCNYVREMSEGL